MENVQLWIIPEQPSSVIVPVYPQYGDMISVKGDQDEMWRAEVRS